MKLCIPTPGSSGLGEEVYGHFGSAPGFTVVDTDDGSVRHLVNGNQNHVHGGCNPARALSGEKIDVVLIKGIGAGAVMRLGQLGIKVFQTSARTVGEAVEQMKAGSLQEIGPQGLCGGHGHGHGCSH